ncbi:hypothetical protein QQF64_018398 [Cirrhinus molitorella]|uniref:Uncharacterized protein n=1 Tax=Cirrhinus molitorella TaxID=172907 RepID=A0ABR3LFZ5_9TELE
MTPPECLPIVGRLQKHNYSERNGPHPPAGLFSIDVLLKSNLTGGVNKVDPSAERRQPLDPKKLTALLSKTIRIYF